MVVNPVLIISYESLRMYAPVLAQTPIGLMLCDEGHRLKNSGKLAWAVDFCPPCTSDVYFIQLAYFRSFRPSLLDI